MTTINTSKRTKVLLNLLLNVVKVYKRKKKFSLKVQHIGYIFIELNVDLLVFICINMLCVGYKIVSLFNSLCPFLFIITYRYYNS